MNPLRDPLERPGFVNAHTHLYSGLVPLGMPAPVEPPRDFREILERVWWRLDRALDLEAIAAGARLYIAEALLHGTTTLFDHHESPGAIEGSLDVLADAAEELGMRAVLCYGATERNGGVNEGALGLEECRRFVATNNRPLVRGMVGLHACFTVSEATARAAGRLARTLGVPLHVHAAEDRLDVADAERHGFHDPVDWLLTLDALPRGSLLAHGVHLDERAVRAVDGRDCWLVQNPRSNHGNRVGYPKALWAGTRVALGTDGFASDMREELAFLTRWVAEHPDCEPGGPMNLAARLGAGRALAAEHFGEREIARDKVWIERSAGPGRVLAVEVAGRRVVEDGKLLTGNLIGIRAEAERQATRVWQRLEALAS
jgi:cytosine/adenosine deaminase-related metal-dependent hydrolase